MGFDVGGVTLTSAGDGTLLMTGSAPWMRVNASGILTRPQMPHMRGQLSGKGNPTGGDGSPLKITADANTGSCWNNTTGLYTAPVAGYYIATAGNLCAATSGYIYIRKNGVDQHFTHWNHSSSWQFITLSAIISCAANDYLSWHTTGMNPAGGCFYGESGHNMYSFALMA
jgi:hypothetical protein